MQTNCSICGRHVGYDGLRLFMSPRKVHVLYCLSANPQQLSFTCSMDPEAARKAETTPPYHSRSETRNFTA